MATQTQLFLENWIHEFFSSLAEEVRHRRDRGWGESRRCCWRVPNNPNTTILHDAVILPLLHTS